MSGRIRTAPVAISSIIAALTLIALFVAGRSLALDPPTPPGGFTFGERPNAPPGPGYNPDIPSGPPPYGGSIWSYSDFYGGLTGEGSYKTFDDQVDQQYTSNPHGGYSTTSNKCQVCHAVHRATGTFRLLRVDRPDDACDYCHIGAHRHSRLGAYTDAGTIYPENGHTIGAGPEIPDSSTWQWLTPKTLTAGDSSSQTIMVRAYDSTRNKMFKWLQTDAGWTRVGPVSLQCTTCHQVHNATMLTWKPNGASYKLLRSSPSGSVDDPDQMRNYVAGSESDPAPIGQVIKAVEGKLSAATTGPGKTIYTRWKGPSIALTQYSLSVWCADCHNLNIAYKEQVSSLFGGWSHSDRSHSAPFGLTGSSGHGGGGSIDGQCYSCHLNDLRPDLSASGCDKCHLTPSGYAAQAATSDFPHSGQPGSYKLLGDDFSATGGPDNSVSSARLDAVCLRCHSDIGVWR